MQTEPTPDTTSRLLAKLIRELLAVERFETLADLTDALKVLCARLRIRWTNDDIEQAIRLVESNHPLVASTLPRETNPRHVERSDETPAFSRQDAANWVALIERTTGKTLPIRRMPPAVYVSQRTADIEKASRMVLDEIKASVARCAELEAMVAKKDDDA